jgi:hypothetical protein
MPAARSFIVKADELNGSCLEERIPTSSLTYVRQLRACSGQNAVTTNDAERAWLTPTPWFVGHNQSPKK